MKSRYKFRVLLFPLFARSRCGSAAACGGGVAVGAGSSGSGGNGGAARRRSCRRRLLTPCARAPAPAPADRRGYRDRPEQLAALVDQRAVPLVRRGHGSRSVAIHHRRLLRPAQDQRRPRASGSPKTNSTSPTTPQCGSAVAGRQLEAGYGAEFAILAGTPPRRIVVAFTEAGSPGGDAARARRRDSAGRRRRRRQRQTPRRSSTRSTPACSRTTTGESHTFMRAQHRGRNAHGDHDLRQPSRTCRCRSSRRSTPPPGRWATSSSTITSPPPKTPLENAITHARQRQRHRPDPRPALQRRRLPRHRERARLHDRQHHADQRPHIREDRLQRQESDRNPVTGETPDARRRSIRPRRASQAQARLTSRCPRSTSTACTSSPGPAPARPANPSSIRCAA